MAPSDPMALPDGVPEDRVDALYGLALDEFTPARDALAAELRKGGEREAAAWVKALRKPSAAAWVVNQLARCRGKEAQALAAAGERLRDTHEQVLAGDAGADALRAGTEAAGEAERALLGAAPGLLSRDGHAPTPATLEKAGATLRAVVLDEQVRAAFMAGRLTREATASGFGPLPAGGAPAAGGGRAGTRRKAKPQPARGAKENARGGTRRSARKQPTGSGRAAGRTKAESSRAKPTAAARKELRDAQAEDRASARTVAAAERELEQARREAQRAQRRLEDATAAMESAGAAASEARARVAAATAALEADG